MNWSMVIGLFSLFKSISNLGSQGVKAEKKLPL